MQSLARVFLFLLLLLSWTASTYSQTQNKQELAEAATDKAIRRFYDTLDFADVYRKFYVSNANLRKAEVEIVMQNMIWSGDHFAKPEQLESRNIDFDSMERAYIAMSNFNWLLAASGDTYEGDEEKFRHEGETIWDKYMTPLNDKTSWPILTSKQLDEKITASFNAIANFCRDHVVRSNFDTPEFRRRQQNIKESRAPDPIDKLKELFTPAGMKNSDTIYLVRRGRFYFYIIEENGEFRVLSWNNRIQD